MQTEEFMELTAQSIWTILRRHGDDLDDQQAHEKRRQPRWPFPGTVELWVTDACGQQVYLLAQPLNISASGVGVLVDHPLAPGQETAIAIHESEATLYGRAVVRHSTAREEGYHVGLEFVF